MCQTVHAPSHDSCCTCHDNHSSYHHSHEEISAVDPKQSSVMVLSMVLDFLRQTNTATSENLKYLESMDARIEKARPEEQVQLKEELLEFVTKVYKNLSSDLEEV